jgi:hypothetical protein
MTTGCQQSQDEGERLTDLVEGYEDLRKGCGLLPNGYYFKCRKFYGVKKINTRSENMIDN